jgi:hypothetical protein
VYPVGGNPQTVAHAVEPGQVRGDLRRGNDVVGRKPVSRVRQARLPHLGPRAFELAGDPLDYLAHAGLYALAHQLGYHPDPQTRDPAFEFR